MLTGGAGRRAIARAFAELFRTEGVAGVSLAGRTDSWIFGELARRHDMTLAGDTLERVREVQIRHLGLEMHHAGDGQRLLPGVRPLLDTLSARDDVYLALLTGNLREGARIKLQHFDVWRYFRCGGFGDVAVERHALYADAVTAAAACSGRTFRPEETVIVGDTPFDIAVGVATGARSVGVATGSYAAEALRAAGADMVLPDLADLAAVLDAFGLPADAER